jgi:hypothetical protein
MLESFLLHASCLYGFSENVSKRCCIYENGIYIEKTLNVDFFAAEPVLAKAG